MTKTATVDAKTPIISNSKENKDKRIKKLEKINVIYIQRAADLLKENEATLRELERVKKERNNLRRHYDKLRKGNKTRCDCDKIMKAMIEYGDIDMSEVLGAK